ncbi:MAG: hypothetical protein ACJ741_04205 [Pyrinomonadaceae bacterium]
MFCPKCGQSQVSDEVRFCSRCGLPLGGVADVLANNGLLPAHLNAHFAAPGAMTPRRKGIRQGGTLMLIGVFLIPMLAILHGVIGLPGEFTLFGVLAVLAGLLRLLYAVIFEEKSPTAFAHAPQPYAQAPAQAQFDPHVRAGALPPSDFRPAPTFFAPRSDTAEIPIPPSVTDHTTRLLDHENDPRER